MICCEADIVPCAALLENGAPIMPSRISDTSAEAERAHIALLRSASPARRLQLALGLSRETLRLSWRGLRRAHPDADEGQIRLLSIRHRYGQRAATAAGAHIEEHHVMPMQPDLLIALTPVISVLHDLGVPYFVGGSVASSMYGMPRSTLDVDLVAELREEHVASLGARLGADYYLSEDAMREAVRTRSSFNLIHLATMLKIDIFVWKARPFDQEAFRRMHEEAVDFADMGVMLSLPTPEDIILAKLEWYRLGNEISERQWNDILGVLKVQATTLDLEYLRHWAGELGVSDLLERALTEAALAAGEAQEE
jgi:hypothetical protein